MLTSSVAERSVIVTGGSRGIGYGIAEVFSDAGARVVLAGRAAGALERAAERLRERGGVAITAVVDITDPESCKRLAHTAIAEFGGIDILCANAGIFPSARINDITPTDLENVMATNLKGTIYCVQACLPALERTEHGRIVVTSSITGPVTGYPGWSHYGASKAAQLGFVRTAALELAAKGVTINAVLPGNIATEGLDELGEDYLLQMTAAIPLGRLGDVRDIGYAALFFASDEARFITGQSLVIDGGQVLPESPQALADI